MMRTHKQTLDKTEHERRKAWRLQAYAATKPASVTVRHTDTPKALRVPKVKAKSVAVGAAVDPQTVLADVFKGSTYRPQVRVTHKQAYEARVAKRAAAKIDHPKRKSMKKRTSIRLKYADGTPIVAELGETAEQIHARRLETLTARIDQAEVER